MLFELYRCLLEIPAPLMFDVKWKKIAKQDKHVLRNLKTPNRSTAIHSPSAQGLIQLDTRFYAFHLTVFHIFR